MDKKDLETRLRAIQELKREKYVGTQMAWKYINRVANLEERPRELADRINEAVRQRFGANNLAYESTPERIIGVVDAVSNLYGAVYLSEDLSDDYAVSEEFISSMENPLVSYFPDFLIGVNNLDGEKLSDYLIPIFLDTQFSPNDYSFGMNAVETCLQTHPLGESNNENVLEVAKKIINWKYWLSREKAREVERHKRRQLLQDLSVHQRAEKMIRDKVDYRLEYRRELVADLIHERDFKTFEEGLEKIKKMLVYSKKLANFPIEVRRFPVNTGINNAKFDAKFEVETNELLLRCFASERRFVKKFLRN